MKLKTTKTFILGFVFGAALFASTSSYASSVYEKISNAYINSSINVSVDGKNVKLKNKPITYKNTNYLPVAEVSSMLNAQTSWDGSKQTISIATNENIEKEDIDMDDTKISATNEVAPNDVVETTFEGMKAILVNGTTYFHWIDYGEQIHLSGDKITAEWNSDMGVMTIQSETRTFKINKSETLIYKGMAYCNSKYYIKP